MKSLVDGLPPEVAALISTEWRKNEADYWIVRESLLAQYVGQWIAFADGAVIAVGTNPVDVRHAGRVSGRHPFVTCVGNENVPCRMRRISFGYDTTYTQQALPVCSVEFRSSSGVPGVLLDRVIPDTGADASAVPWADCQTLQLDLSKGDPGLILGWEPR